MAPRNDIAHAADMAVFDRLPARLRAALAASPYPAKAVVIEQLLRGLEDRGLHINTAVDLIIDQLAQAWLDNLQAFADGYWRRYRVPLPHVAAGASFLMERRW